MEASNTEGHEFAEASSISFDDLSHRLNVDQFHDFQLESLRSVLQKRDVFLILPTGSGKSFCYVMPALTTPGLVLVICPLIALMRDQVAQLRLLGVQSTSLDSHCSMDEKLDILNKVKFGHYKILFVSPERMAQKSFRDLLRSVSISLIAVDEAHCVHHWGQGFRPEYQRLGRYIEELGTIPLMALTATVTKKEQIDICLSLGLQNPKIIEKVSPRSNLDLNVFSHKNIEGRKRTIQDRVIELDGQGIVYCSTRRAADEFYYLLRAQGERVSLYHAGLGGEERNTAQAKFSSGESRVLIATKAFGMGLNIPNIRFILHSDMPSSIEDYTQEVGRAGRDGLLSVCELHYGPKDFFIQKFMIEKDFPSEELFEKVTQRVQGTLERDYFISSAEVFSIIPEQLNLERETVESILNFLYREEYVIPAANSEGLLGWTSSEKFFDLQEIIMQRQEQFHWRMGRLRNMHALIKNGTEGIRGFIEKYFS